MIDLPVAAKTDADKVAYCYRALERLRLWHNEHGLLVPQKKLTLPQFREWQRVEYRPRCVKTCARLNSLRDQRVYYKPDPRTGADDARQVTIDAERKGYKLAGLADSSWDQWIDPDKLLAAEVKPPLPDPTENLTTYTEVDPNSHITPGPGGDNDKAAFAGLSREETAYLVTDDGAGFWSGDWDIDGEVYVDANTGTAYFFWLCFANTASDWKTILDADGDAIGLRFRVGSSQHIYENDGGDLYSDDYGAADPSTPYYHSKLRDDDAGTHGTVYDYIYSDAARTTLLDTLSVALHSQLDYRYFFALQSGNYGNNATNDGYINEIDRHQAAAANVPAAFDHYMKRRRA